MIRDPQQLVVVHQLRRHVLEEADDAVLDLADELVVAEANLFGGDQQRQVTKLKSFNDWMRCFIKSGLCSSSWN